MISGLSWYFSVAYIFGFLWDYQLIVLFYKSLEILAAFSPDAASFNRLGLDFIIFYLCHFLSLCYFLYTTCDVRSSKVDDAAASLSYK